jgi:Zn-dependent M28 family amino/carboxypeptidase
VERKTRGVIAWIIAPGILLTVLVATGPAIAATATLHERFNPQQAYAYTAKVVSFGERWPGSSGHAKTEELIHQVLRKDGAQIEADDFTAKTPRGPVAVHNIIGKFNVTADPKQKIFILAGHYDTLFQPGFLGANDGGSSTAILLAFADALAGQKTKMQIWLVWTDLEEAIKAFDANDGLYGSRHLAGTLAANGTATRVAGFFLLDMIGDKDLSIARETTSTRWLQDYIAKAAGELGDSQYFFRYEASIIDDQVPFLQVGIPAVDVVDAMYGRMGRGFDNMGEFHHANTDTMDKVSAQSLDVVGRTILRTVELLDQQPL